MLRRREILWILAMWDSGVRLCPWRKLGGRLFVFAASVLYIYLLGFFQPNYPIDVELTNCSFLSNYESARRRVL